MNQTNSRPSEIWVILIVVVGLVAAEGLISLLRPQLSGDIRHLDESDDIVREVVAGDGLRVVVGGNSLIGEGVDGAILEAALELTTGEEVTVGVIKPDGTGPLEWDYLFRKIMFNPGEHPDVLVLGFGPGHMIDVEPRVHLLRLGVHHVDWPDQGRLSSFDGLGFEERMTVALASLSATFGLRDRVSARVFAALIPNYRALAPILLRGDAPERDPTNLHTYRHINALLDVAGTSGVPVVLLKMPAQRPYEVEEEVFALEERPGVVVLDLDPFPELLGPEMYTDQVHLDEAGRTLFSNEVAPELAEAIQRAIERR